MKGMRNRVAHGYLDLDIVWATVESALPSLLAQLDGLSPTDDASS